MVGLLVSRRKLHTGRPPLSETMDRHVLQFLQEQRRLGIQVGVVCGGGCGLCWVWSVLGVVCGVGCGLALFPVVS